MIYMLIYFWGVLVVASGPLPYTLEECFQSISVIDLPAELDATATCVEVALKPQPGVLTQEQQQAVGAWAAAKEKGE